MDHFKHEILHVIKPRNRMNESKIFYANFWDVRRVTLNMFSKKRFFTLYTTTPQKGDYSLLFDL